MTNAVVSGIDYLRTIADFLQGLLGLGQDLAENIWENVLCELFNSWRESRAKRAELVMTLLFSGVTFVLAGLAPKLIEQARLVYSTKIFVGLMSLWLIWGIYLPRFQDSEMHDFYEAAVMYTFFLFLPAFVILVLLYSCPELLPASIARPELLLWYKWTIIALCVGLGCTLVPVWIICALIP